MVTTFLLYSLYPAFITAFSILLFLKAYQSNAGTHYLALFGNLIFINICQTIIYGVIPYSFTIASYAADAYLIAAYFLFTHFILLALNLSESERGNWIQFLYVPPVILTILHVSGFMIDSYRLVENAIVHSDGELAWAFDAFLLAASMTTVATFFINVKQIRKDYLLQSRNLIALISFIPFIIAASILVILSNTAHVVPVVTIIPTLSLYIVLVFYYISRSQIIDLTIGPKAFFKRLKVAYLLLSSLRTKKDLDDFNRQLQLLKYNEAMQKHQNNFNAAAEELKVHPTTLRNALKN